MGNPSCLRPELRFFVPPLKKGCWKDSVGVGTPCDCVIPAWSAGIQTDMDVFGRILQVWVPAIHAGMTEEKAGMGLCFSCSVGERKIMKSLRGECVFSLVLNAF
jgi:hypothetical protein